MNKDTKILNPQIKGLIVSTTVGVGVLSLPNGLSTNMGNDGWIAIIISGLLILLSTWVINQIFKQNPDKDFFQIGKETLGTVVFNICKLLMVAYFVASSSYIARNLAALIKAFLLPRTPHEVTILVFILASSYLACYEIDAIARAGYFIYPIILGFAILIILIALPNADYTNLLPSFQTKITTIPKAVYDSFFSFTGFEIIIFALPFIKEKDKALKTCFKAIGIVTAIYVIVFIMCIVHFSNEQIERHIFPVLQVTRQLDLPGYFLENLDGLVMAIWVVAVFATMTPAYFAAGKVLSKIFKTKGHKYFIWALVPIIYQVSLIPDNVVELRTNMGLVVNVLASITIIIIPALILLVGYIRKKVKI